MERGIGKEILFSGFSFCLQLKVTFRIVLFLKKKRKRKSKKKIIKNKDY